MDDKETMSKFIRFKKMESKIQWFMTLYSKRNFTEHQAKLEPKR